MDARNRMQHAKSSTFTRCLFILLGFTLALGGCARNAATGRMQGNMMSLDQEIAIGQQFASQFRQQAPLVEDAAINGYLTEVGMGIAAHVEEPYRELPWAFHLVDQDTVNAFALPGGQIFLYRGLVEKMDSEAQLAGVLAHEIGHVTAEHADARQTVGLVVNIGAIVAAALISEEIEDDTLRTLVPIGVQLGAVTGTLAYSRTQEAEADGLGMRYMVRAGYDPAGLRELMEILQEESAGGRSLEIFATHPHPETRIATIDAELQGPYLDAAQDPLLGDYADRFRVRMLEPLTRYVPPVRTVPAPAQERSGEAGDEPERGVYY